MSRRYKFPSARQLDYVELLAQGYTYEQMADALSVSTNTVKNMMDSRRKAYNVTNSIDLVVLFLQHGWISLNTLRRTHV